MLAANYSYTHQIDSPRQFTIVLTQNATGKTRTFVAVGKSLDGHLALMESLTDACCDGFFPEERKPKEKKQK